MDYKMASRCYTKSTSPHFIDCIAIKSLKVLKLHSKNYSNQYHILILFCVSHSCTIVDRKEIA